MSSRLHPAGNAFKGRDGGEREGRSTGAWDESGVGKGTATVRGTRAPDATQGQRDTPHAALTAAFAWHSHSTQLASWFWQESGGPVTQDKGSLLQAYLVLAVHVPGAETYLGFIDRAVESVVFLIIEQAEIQCPQRGCKGENTLLTRRAQQTLALLPLSTKGLGEDAREMAADIIKHKAVSCEPCYETWLHAGRLMAIPTFGRWGRHSPGRGARGMNGCGSPRHCSRGRGFASVGFHMGHPHLSAAPPQPAASHPPGAEGSSPGRSGHGWDTAETRCQHISPPSSAAGIPRMCICILTPSNK